MIILKKHSSIGFALVPFFSLLWGEPPAPKIKAELGIIYSRVGGMELKLNAFIPQGVKEPAPAMLFIHGGWWSGGRPPGNMQGGRWQRFTRKGIALFSNQYRLGKKGGFPENIRDCRNAVRYIRKHARHFNIDPDRIGVFGTSAGSHLSMMVAVAPQNFEDGGPTEGLEDISAKVCNAFAIVGPTDFVRQWNESVQGKPNNARPYFKVLFKSREPDTGENKAFYMKMCPMGHLRKDVPPMLICDGEKDPVVTGLHGKVFVEKLKSLGADATYWMTPGGGHGWPGGKGFTDVLDGFLLRTLKIGREGQ